MIIDLPQRRISAVLESTSDNYVLKWTFETMEGVQENNFSITEYSSQWEA